MTERAKKRPQRTPLGARNRLTVSGKDPNFVYRWINDQEDRVERAKEAGYELVPKSGHAVGDPRAAEASPMGAFTSKAVGGGTTAYLMRIPKEYYEEDQAAKQSALAETERGMKPKTAQGQYGEGLTKE